MSTVSSVSGYGTELLQILQQSTRTQTGATAAGGMSQMTERLAEGLSDNRAQKFEEQLATFAEESGLDAEQVAALQEDVRSAISAALEESDESTDHRTAIKNAVGGVLESYGLDANAFDEEMKANAPPPPSGGMGGFSPGGLTAGDTEAQSTTAMSQLLSMLSGGSDDSGLLANLSLLDAVA